ncbi:hypothetical protein VLK31_27445 [Variovorax sp. H27-G14]|uniref:hypothetical protein n=1 Tax=Variovorax sp. H27-G14 TaxID=3111914 RepID=UPI0038FD1FD7
MIAPDEIPLRLLNSRGVCESTDARIRALLVDLEREGVTPEIIASSQARVLLGFCAEHARNIENYGWIATKLMALTEMLELRHSEASYNNWVGRFLGRQKRLYNEARFRMKADMEPPPPPPFALVIAKTQGQA